MTVRQHYMYAEEVTISEAKLLFESYAHSTVTLERSVEHQLDFAFHLVINVGQRNYRLKSERNKTRVYKSLTPIFNDYHTITGKSLTAMELK